MVLTHCHDDHLAGLIGILQQYRVGRVMESGWGGGPLYQEWLAMMTDRQIPVSAARAGEEIDLGQGIVLQVISPLDKPLEGTESEANSNSLVLRLTWKEVSFLLAGDADTEAEKRMLYEGPASGLRSDVLKVGHHGSSSSTSAAFLAAVDPEAAVISAGAGNLFGHPAEATLAALGEADAEVYRTDLQGTITFTTDGERLWVRTARGPTPR